MKLILSHQKYFCFVYLRMYFEMLLSLLFQQASHEGRTYSLPKLQKSPSRYGFASSVSWPVVGSAFTLAC